MNIKNYMKQKKKKFSIGGQLPTDTKSKITLFVSGILKHLNIKKSYDNLLSQHNGDIRKLELLSGGKNTPTFKVSTNNTSDIVATEVAEYFKECLATQGLGLNPEGTDYVCQLVGETINNCQLHSGDFRQWFTLGHYYSEEGNGYGECQLVLFNFGQTIYEGLKRSTKSQEMIEALNKITQTHIKKGFFNRSNWDEETLWTLYALQDGVSRMRFEGDPDRGTGTVKLIDSFQNIGSTMDGKNGNMSILSGNTHIYFDGTYKLKHKEINNEVREIIAFNEINDLEFPPDKNYVKKIDNYFPGTVISMNFFIDRRYIRKLKENNNDN